MREKNNRRARLHRLAAIISTGPAAAPVKFAVTRKTAPTKRQAMAAEKRASAVRPGALDDPAAPMSGRIPLRGSWGGSFAKREIYYSCNFY